MEDDVWEAAEQVPRLLAGVRRIITADGPADALQSLCETATEAVRTREPALAVALDDDGGIVARAPPRTDVPAELRELGVECFRHGRPCLLDDVTEVRGATASAAPEAAAQVRSMVLAPIAERWVLAVGAPAPAAFTETDRDVLGQLGSITEAAVEGGDDPGELMEDLRGILAHDIRSPLNAAAGWVEVLQADHDLDHLDDVQGALRRVEEYLDSATTMLETGYRQGAPEPVELSTAVENAEPLVDRDSVEIEVEDSGVIRADEHCLRELLENLIRNAYEHAGPGVQVRIGTTESGFYVEDDGPGIDPDRREAVLERGESSKDGHAGVGLHIVDRLADLHGWELEIGEGTAGGARFEFSNVELVTDE